MEIGGIRVKFRWVGGGIPILPHKSNFHQTLSIKDFYVGYLPFKGFLRIVLSICNKFLGMSWHKKTKIESTEELWEEIRVVIECLHGIPSMSDKLPNYIYNRIESIIEYVKEKGWS